MTNNHSCFFGHGVLGRGGELSESTGFRAQNPGLPIKVNGES